MFSDIQTYFLCERQGDDEVNSPIFQTFWKFLVIEGFSFGSASHRSREWGSKWEDSPSLRPQQKIQTQEHKLTAQRKEDSDGAGFVAVFLSQFILFTWQVFIECLLSFRDQYGDREYSSEKGGGGIYFLESEFPNKWEEII